MRSHRDHARAGSYADSGGESVRICNPCVPDPNTTPPPQNGPNQLSPARSRSVSNGVSGSYTASPILNGDDVVTPDMLRGFSRQRPRSTFGLSRSRSSTVCRDFFRVLLNTLSRLILQDTSFILSYSSTKITNKSNRSEAILSTTPHLREPEQSQ